MSGCVLGCLCGKWVLLFSVILWLWYRSYLLAVQHDMILSIEFVSMLHEGGLKTVEKSYRQITACLRGVFLVSTKEWHLGIVVTPLLASNLHAC